MGMQGGGKVGGRRHVALLMSLLLMMTAWQTLAIAAEGDVEEPVVAAEEPVIEADVAIETDEAAETGDEEAVLEQEAQPEELQEAVKSDQAEGEQVVEVEADTQLDDEPLDQSEGDFSFADGAICGYVDSGEVTYDEATNTLTLNAAAMNYLYVNMSATIELVGDSSIEGSLDFNGEGTTLTVEGEGTLSCDGTLCAGEIYDSETDCPVYTGNVILRSGTLDFGIYCNDLSVTGGSIKGDIYCKNISITGGSIEGFVSCECDVELANEGISIDTLLAKNVTISAGTVTGGVISGRQDDGGSDEWADGYTYTGTVTVTGGFVKGGITAGTVILNGGSVSGRVACSTFHMRKGAEFSAVHNDDESGYPIRCTTFAMWGGTIAFSNFSDGIQASEKFSMAGGTITAKASSDVEWNGAAAKAGTSFYMKGGTISATNFPTAVRAKTATMVGGTVKGGIDADAITMSQGTVTGKVYCLGTIQLSGGTITYVGKSGSDYSSGISAATLSMTGGTINVSKCDEGITVYKSFAMSKGTVTIASCDCGIVSRQYASAKTANIAIKGGKVTVTNPSRTGIEAVNGNITMTGGTVSVTGAYGSAVQACGDNYRGTKYGGRIKVTGGKLTAKVRKPSRYAALDATYGVTNKVACLGAISGSVAEGTSFKTGGNTYKVNKYLEVRLVKYGSSKTSASLTRVKFGGNTYNVSGVAKNAFATKQGKKLKSLSFGNTLDYLGPYAFKGTSSLTTLKLNLATTVKKSGSTWKVTTQKGYGSYAKTAFKGAGKNGGKGLTVKCGLGEARTGYRTYLRSLGLSSGAKVVGYR